MRLLTEDPRDVDVELVALRSKWGILLHSHPLTGQAAQAVASRLNDIQQKLQGVRYHRENFDRHETEMERQFSNSGPPTGAEMQHKVPGLIFEVEGFLYQTKSVLDMLSQVFRDAGFQSVGESFGNHGERILKQLQTPPKSCRQEAQTLIEIVTKAQTTWIDQVISIRDYIAHRGMIEEMGSFIRHPYVGGASAGLTYPHLPNGQRVAETRSRTNRYFVPNQIRPIHTRSR